MREVEFRIVGLTDRRIRFERRLRRPPKPGAAIVALAAVVVVFAFGRGQPNGAHTHTVVFNGKEVSGDRALVLVDNSGSVTRKGLDPEIQLAKLAAAGVSIKSRVNIHGFAISFTDYWSMLQEFNLAIAASSDVDAVYVISDFDGGDDEANDPIARLQLQLTLKRRHARIYWVSMYSNPSAEYSEIARQSGGDVILAK